MIEPTFSKVDQEGYVVSNTCSCDNVTAAYVTAPEVFAWRQGAFVQDAFPSLDPADREALFISGVCWLCFERMYEGF